MIETEVEVIEAEIVIEVTETIGEMIAGMIGEMTAVMIVGMIGEMIGEMTEGMIAEEVVITEVTIGIVIITEGMMIPEETEVTEIGELIFL